MTPLFFRSILKSSLKLENWQIALRLGHGEQERAQPQTVSFDLQLDFKRCPRAIFSDNIEDTINYHQLLLELEDALKRKTEYRLIEHLAGEAYRFLREKLPSSIKIKLTVSKNPPMDNLTAARFSLGD